MKSQIELVNLELQKSCQDKRYTITMEHGSRQDPRFVARFCGDVIPGSFNFSDDDTSAIMACILHQGTRLGIL